MNLQIVWKEFLKLVQEELGSHVVNTWFKSISLEGWTAESCRLILSVPNNFVLTWIKKNYFFLFEKHLPLLINYGQPIEFDIVVKQKISSNSDLDLNSSDPSTGGVIPARDASLSDKLVLKKKSSVLEPCYTFDNFVVGPNNYLAYSGAVSVSQGQAKGYNPLFIYGRSGLGKTHLLHCIGNSLLLAKPQARVIYKSADSFIEEFIKAIRNDKIHAFREKYFKVDLLLLDDVQFFSHKEQTQEMFFNIFNKIYEAKKQLVLTSDTPPDKIVGFQDRLKSRLGWGLTADIFPPSIETKVAILMKKAADRKLNLSPAVAEFVAQHFNYSIREMEGFLTRLGAMSSLTGQSISIDLAQRELFKGERPSSGEEVQGCVYDHILTEVSKEYSVAKKDLFSKDRSKNIAQARQVAAYLLKKRTKSCLTSIGRTLGGRSHSTIAHAIDLVQTKIKSDTQWQNKLDNIESRL